MLCPTTCPWAHLDFEPEFSDARESFKCVQSLDFNTVILVIQHGAHQHDVISSTSRGLMCARRDRRGRKSGCPGPTVAPPPPAISPRPLSTTPPTITWRQVPGQSDQSRGQGSAVASRGQADWEEPPASLPSPQPPASTHSA